MKSNWEKGEKLELGILLFAAVFIGAFLMVIIFAFWNPCDAAESAIVSFDSPEHLVALTDSVVGVCDTTWVDGMHLCNPFPRDTGWIQGAVGHGLVNITCRELVCVTVVRDFKLRMVDRRGILRQVGTPGEAIIDYREVKQ